MSIFELNPVGTTSALGREIRLRRILGEDGKMMTVALDQAVPRGVAPRLADLKNTFDRIMEGEPDAFTVFKGVAGHLLSGRAKQIPLIIKGSTFCVDFHLTYDATVAQVGPGGSELEGHMLGRVQAVVVEQVDGLVLLQNLGQQLACIAQVEAVPVAQPVGHQPPHRGREVREPAASVLDRARHPERAAVRRPRHRAHGQAGAHRHHRGCRTVGGVHPVVRRQPGHLVDPVPDRPVLGGLHPPARCRSRSARPASVS